MGRLEVEVSALAAASARFKDAAQQLQDGLSSVDLETTQLLGSGWKGGAATAFGTAWDGWHNGAGQVVRGLQSMGDMLSLAGKEYAKTDSDSAGALNSTMGGAGSGGGSAAGGAGLGSSSPSGSTAGSGSGAGAAQSGGAGGAEQLASLAQQMVGALGQVGQLGEGLSQAVGQAAQLATGIVQTSTQAAAQGQQGGADPAGKDVVDEGKTAKDEDGRDKDEKEKAEEDRDSETDGAAGPSVEQPGLKAPVDGPSDVAAPTGPLPARPQTRPADDREV
ncbi:WXG100 family type VII secretion target [Mycobacterium sp. HM-7]